MKNVQFSSYKNTTSWEKLVEELESRGVLLSEEKKMYEEKLLAEAQARQEEHSRYLVRLISFNKIFKFPEGKKKGNQKSCSNNAYNFM